MVLIFLRDWRSALIVVMNIPFALAERRDSAVGHGPDHQYHDAGRAGARGGRSGGRSHGGHREYSYADAAGRIARTRGAGSLQQTAIARLLSMFCILAVFVPSFLHDRRGPAAFRSAVPGGRVFDDRFVFALEQPGSGVFHLAHEGSIAAKREEGLFGWLRGSSTNAICDAVLRFRWPLVLGYLAAAIGLMSMCSCRAWEREIFPDANAPLLRIRLRAPAGTRIEETERIVLRALDVIQQEAGRRTTSRSPAISSG